MKSWHGNFKKMSEACEQEDKQQEEHRCGLYDRMSDIKVLFCLDNGWVHTRALSRLKPDSSLT